MSDVPGVAARFNDDDHDHDHDDHDDGSADFDGVDVRESGSSDRLFDGIGGEYGGAGSAGSAGGAAAGGAADSPNGHVTVTEATRAAFSTGLVCTLVVGWILWPLGLIGHLVFGGNLLLTAMGVALASAFTVRLQVPNLARAAVRVQIRDRKC